MYKVFKLDISFDPYSQEIQFVAAKSIQDIIDHLPEIYPDYVEKVIREEWMNEDDWNDISEFGKYKEGDEKHFPAFSEKEIQELKKSVNNDNIYSRIKEVPNLFSDKPYIILESFCYIE